MDSATPDPIWERIRGEAEEDARQEPLLASFLYSVVLNHKSLEDALSYLLASKLGKAAERRAGGCQTRRFCRKSSQ